MAIELIKREPKDVWFVWTRTGHKPTYAHASKDRALAEAERLALLNPGKKFIVMQCHGKYSVDPKYICSLLSAVTEAAQAAVKDVQEVTP